jgi:uncharacterized protein YbjT (DUF2867 family)
MKYVITGSLGHISKPIAVALVNAGHETIVITSNHNKLKEIESIGAKAAVGSVEDPDFIGRAFANANAVYLMIPPNFASTGWREYQNKVADTYVNALRTNNIHHAVVLSSVGAHMGNGAGPVDGLADLEKKLSALQNLHVKILRPSYFYYNLFGMIPLMKNMNIMGSNFGNTEEKLILTDTGDIADAAIEELLSLNFKGQSIRYIASDERHPNEIAEVLSKSVGKSAPWVSFSDEQALGGMVQAGLPQSIAEGYVTMGKGIREGRVQEHYWQNRPSKLGKIKLEDFAKQFAAAYDN